MTTALRIAWQRVKAVLSRRHLDREFDEELASHLEFLIEEGRNRGLAPEQARREALQKLGGMQSLKEMHRDTRGMPILESIGQDLTHAARMLGKTRGFTLMVVASLALGIGANTAVFTLINAALLRMLPVPHAEELVVLQAAPVLSFAMYRDLREHQQVFTDILASTREWPVRLVISTPAGPITLDNVPTSFVTPNYFPVLGVQPQIGRFFIESEDQNPGSAESQGSFAVLSDGFWERQFARDSNILNRVIHVNRSPCRVIGVAPRGFSGEVIGYSTDVWVPLVSFSPRRYLENRRGGWATCPSESLPSNSSALSPRHSPKQGSRHGM